MTFEEYAALRTPSLLRYATVLACDPHLAEDIVQEVLVRAKLHWRKVSRADHPDRYVRRMVTNEFLSWRRRKAVRAVVPVTHDDLAGLAGPVPDAMARYDERDALLARVAALPARQRAVIALRYYEGLPDEEIADLLGCRPVTVRSYASRALATLRVSLVDQPTTF